MIKTGIYGGSFNPIHNGHIQLAEWLCQHGGLDELWFLVSPQNPLKQADTDLLPEKDRLALAQLAVKSHPRLKVSDFEFNLPRPSFTVNTLQKLRDTYPEHNFTLIIGADNWLFFSHWKNPQEILHHHNIIIYPRNGYTIYPTSLPKNVKLVPAPLFNISSTEIRQCIANGEDASYALDKQVWKTIAEKGYYRKK